MFFICLTGVFFNVFFVAVVIQLVLLPLRINFKFDKSYVIGLLSRLSGFFSDLSQVLFREIVCNFCIHSFWSFLIAHSVLGHLIPKCSYWLCRNFVCKEHIIFWFLALYFVLQVVRSSALSLSYVCSKQLKERTRFICIWVLFFFSHVKSVTFSDLQPVLKLN